MQDQGMIRIPAALLALCLALGGCEKASSAPTKAAAAPALPAYQLVTVVRPESITDHIRPAKVVYEQCASTAALLKLPVKPFVAVPASFVAERLTQTSDGQSFYMKKQQYGIDIDELTPQQGCATRIKEEAVIERVHKGVVEHIDVDKDGKQVAAEPGEPGPHMPRHENLTAFTESRIEHGVALKCLPKGSAALVPGMLSASCLVDAGAGKTLRDADGNALTAYMRDEASGKQFSVLVQEPVSVSIGSADTQALSGALK